MTDYRNGDVFIDVCTQREYLAADGVCRCKNAAQVAGNLKHLMAYARLARIPVLSCIDTRRTNYIGEDQVLKGSHHRLERKKAPFSLLPTHTVIESDNRLCVSLSILKRHQQAIFTKYHRDPFTNPKLDRLLTEMPVHRFVVFGVPLETSIRILVLGLMRRERRVIVVNDACGYWNHDEAAMALRQIDVKGCQLSSTEALVRAGLLPGPNGRNGRAKHNGNGRNGQSVA